MRRSRKVSTFAEVSNHSHYLHLMRGRGHCQIISEESKTFHKTDKTDNQKNTIFAKFSGVLSGFNSESTQSKLLPFTLMTKVKNP